MSDPLQALPLRYRYDIGNAIRSGDKLRAIKLYREAVGCDLTTAHREIELLEQQMRAANPYAFQQQTRPQGCGCLVFMILLAAVLAGVTGVFTDGVDFERLRRYWEPKSGEKNAPPPQQIRPAAPADSQALPQIRAVPVQPIPPQPEDTPDEPYRVVVPARKELDLVKLYREKFANPAYVRWYNLPGLPQGYQDYPEEHAIKYGRARLAENRRSPLGTSVAAISTRPGRKITIDGIIEEYEWRDARHIALEPQTTGSVLYLQADAEWLYIACDAPGETTEAGFDQLRFYFHVDVDPAIKNERIHLGRHDRRLGGIRETTVIENGRIVNDWQIFRMARGATTLRQHRQYEAKIHLAESGLPRGVSFPVFVELETDPLKENGKFKKRVYLGSLGSQQQPVWLIIL